MALNYSHITIAGRLGRDPELRTTQAGKRVASFSVAVDIGYGNSKNTEWYDVSAWEHAAEFASKYLKKGDSVLCEGTMRSRSYTDSNGNKKKSWEVNARNVQAVGGWIDSKQEGFPADDEDGELPF